MSRKGMITAGTVSKGLQASKKRTALIS